MPSSMRSWRYRVLALVLGTVVALLLGEGVVRALGLAPQLGAIEIDTAHGSFVSSPNPVLKYVPKPGAGDINAAGCRDRDYEIDKPRRRPTTCAIRVATSTPTSAVTR
jgi:hypothetical protein